MKMNKKLLEKNNKPLNHADLINFNILVIDGLKKYATTPHQAVALLNSISLFVIEYMQDWGIKSKIDNKVLLNSFGWFGDHHKLLGESVLQVLNEHKKVDESFAELVTDLISSKMPEFISRNLPEQYKTKAWED